MKEILTSCTRDCWDACSVIAQISEDGAIKLSGNKKHPITKGYLCKRVALHYHERARHPSRLKRPLKKIGGSFSEISWDTALNEIAEIIAEAKNDFGPFSILFYRGTGSLSILKILSDRFFNLLGGATFASGTLCGGAGEAGMIKDVGRRYVTDYTSMKNAKTVILWGRNPSATGPHMLPFLTDFKKEGKRVIGIQATKNEIDSFCDLSIKPVPGSDAFLAIAICKTIIENSWHNTDFIKNHCNGFEDFIKLISKYSQNDCLKACGVSEDNVKNLAYIISHEKPVLFYLGFGLQRYSNGAETFRLIDALSAITGNFGKEGSGVSQGMDEYLHFESSLSLNGTVPVRKIPKGIIGRGIMEAKDPPIKAAFIFGGNPVCQSPNANIVQKALKEISTLVVCDSFLTDTAILASYVLPATTFLEEMDILASYGHSYISIVQPVMEPFGESRSDLQILQGLADKLGIKGMEGNAEEWIDRFTKPLKPYGITLDLLKNKGFIRSPIIPKVPFKDGTFFNNDKKFHFVKSLLKCRINTPNGYPLRLLSISGPLYHSSQSTIEEQKPFDISISPETAHKFSLTDGMMVKLFSKSGEFYGILRFDEQENDGIAVIKKGGWISMKTSANLITVDNISAGEGTPYYDTYVGIEPVE